jgi:glycerol kinase
MRHLLALDQGTSSCRSIVFDQTGHPVAMAQQELRQIYPRPGWVEHDPREIWATQLATVHAALAQAGLGAGDIVALGITNQRETTFLWNRRTGEPVHHAIVWQDRRAEPLCEALRAEGWAPLIQARTGLVVDAYFSASKLKWLLDEVPGARAAAERGELAFGTADSWLLWHLTRGRVHATDASNAARTMLFDIRAQAWDAELLSLFGIPPSVLPQVHPSSHGYGEVDAGWFGAPIPIGGVAGDQQSALFGQACFTPGMAKNTYGTGCFMLMHAGDQFNASAHGLITTSAAQAAGPPAFALEGSVFIGGAVVQWLRDGLRAIQTSADVQALAQSVPDAGGVIVVPAFTGLGAPYWNAQARGAILGLNRGSTLAHIARAALESIAFQSAALFDAMCQDISDGDGLAITELRVDGGACVNDLLMQFQADLLGIPVVRPRVTETTALGAAYLAGLSTGVYRDTDQISQLWQAERRFEPMLGREEAAGLRARWEHAVRQTVAS